MKFVRLLKRWINMICGKSVYHVKQGKGKYYSKKEVKGYYNDMTKKVTSEIKLDDFGIPVTTTINNISAYFPISIFQYGLGLYDLYLETKKEEYLKSFLNIADWAVNNINPNGMWNCMDKVNDSKHLPQSAMCQSEGISILLRAYVSTNNKKYMDEAKKALNYMLIDVNNGGTCVYIDDKVIFQEYVSKEYNLSVLNGWIFSIFGLYDYVLLSNENKYKELLEKTVNSLAIELKKYDRKFWSNYDQKGTIASPAYHDIHIMQLTVLYDLFNKKEFIDYANRWKKYQSNKFYKILSIFVKLKQKIFKSAYYDINTSTV